MRNVETILKNVSTKVVTLIYFYEKTLPRDIYRLNEQIDSMMPCVCSATFNDLAEKLGIVEAIPRKTNIQRNAQTLPVLVQLIIAKKSVAIPLLDSRIIQMQDRVSDEDRHARHCLYLEPSIIVNNTLELPEVTEGMLFWENNLPLPKSLGNELRRWQTMWQSAEKELPSNFLLALDACDVDAFPNIHRLLLIACTLPISSAEAERSFSLMKRIKTYTRSTMSEDRFSDLAVIAMQYPERFEVDEICEAFVRAHPRRLFQATLFD